MTYPGGKGGAGVAQTIINQMPPHDVYCEPFLGGGAVMRAKRPALKSIGVDIAPAVIAAFGDGAGAELHCADAMAFLASRRWWARDLIYCDPPYVRSSRRSPRAIYDNEMTDREHMALLTTLKGLPCMVMISGYRNGLYDANLIGWRRLDFQAMTRGGVATESLWCNFEEPDALHDYRYLGGDFRERERIKRKRERWRRKWATMPTLERRAILAAIEDAGSSRHL